MDSCDHIEDLRLKGKNGFVHNFNTWWIRWFVPIAADHCGKYSVIAIEALGGFWFSRIRAI
jgi:hypothetical protein